MTMLLIAKELAEAVVKCHLVKVWVDGFECAHCKAERSFDFDKCEEIINHDSNCIVVRAKLLLEQEWGIK